MPRSRAVEQGAQIGFCLPARAVFYCAISSDEGSIMLLPFLAASVLTLAAAPAQGGTPAQPAATPVAAAAPVAAEPAADPNKRVCRRFAATGSMIPSRRECRTAAEWNRLADAAQAQGRDVVERARSGTTSN
jgi:hypothetical protein